MELKTLFAETELIDSVGSMDIDIKSLAYDSRAVEEGALYFALPGMQADGNDYIPQALERGAVAVVSERCPEGPVAAGVCFVQVPNVRLAMALTAARFFDDPTRGIPVIGVTGTNGKTTITYLLESILKQAGFKPAVFGTVEYRCGEQRLAASHTTPESVVLMQVMTVFRQQGADAMILEVSSHALEQHRVDGIEFDLAVFTNLTQDHLDYHLTLDSYFNSKKRLFTELLGGRPAVINCDDECGQALLNSNSDWTAFGHADTAAVRPLSIAVGREGIHGTFSCDETSVSIESDMIGEFNVSNLMAAMAAALRLDIPPATIARGIAAAPQVPGRVERVDNEKGILALVDYAHTGDALEQVLKTVSKIESQRLIAIAGCGGDRDPGKRPIMACVAARFADLAVFTSDNPRTEDPLTILEQMRQGALAGGFCEVTQEQALAGERGFVVIPDRRTAINFAAGLAERGDLLLVAGKGHEDYQILGTEKIHFDDREELGLALNENRESCHV